MSRPLDPTPLVHICSFDTLKARLAKVTIKPDLIIWDVCHHLGAAGWTAVVERYPEAYHVGLSAMPCRLDGSGLDKHFDFLVEGPSVEWLIEQGFLSPYRVFAPSSPDMAGVRTRMGDFVEGDAADKMTLTGDAIEHWKDHANGLKTVIFAVTVAQPGHRRRVQRCRHPCSSPGRGTPKEERAETIRRFAAGELLVLTNVSLFGEGFDLGAAAGKDVTSGLRRPVAPNAVVSLYLQMVGRALRPRAGYDAVLPDSQGVMVSVPEKVAIILGEAGERGDQGSGLRPSHVGQGSCGQ